MTGRVKVVQAFLLAFVISVGFQPLVHAQTGQDLPPGLIDQLMNRANTGPGNALMDTTPSVSSPLDQMRQLRGSGQPNGRGGYQFGPPRLPRSKLELDYSRRAGMTLSQFGYDSFRSMIPSSGDLISGAADNNYHLGVGDELVVQLVGPQPKSMRIKIDRDGRLVIPSLAPIPAAGRPLYEVRADIENQVAQAFLNTEAFVSLGAVRQISVAVMGEAVAPGIYRMGGFANALDAIAFAQGIKKTGSLRRIILKRGSEVIPIDLYGVMMGSGDQSDLSLTEGDRIVIPPIGPTIAIAGEIGRPGIFELPRSGQIGAQEIETLAGSPLRPEGNRFIKLSLDATGRDQTTQLPSVRQASLRTGDVLLVLRNADVETGSVRLDGYVRTSGVRSLALAPDARSLIGSNDAFLDNPYLLMGAIQRTDPQTRARIMIPVNLEAVMNGQQVVPLQSGDTLIVLGVGDVNYIASADVQAVLQGQAPPSLTKTIVMRNPRATIQQRPVAEVTAGQVSRTNGYTNDDESNAADFYGSGAPSQMGLQYGQSTDQYDQRTERSFGTAQASGSQQTGSALPNTPEGNALATTLAADRITAKNEAQICRGLQALSNAVVTTTPGRFAGAIIATSAITNTSTEPGSNVTGPSSAVNSTALTAAAGGSMNSTGSSTNLMGGPTNLTVGPTNLPNEFLCPRIFDKYPELLPLIVASTAVIQGEVKIPGLYPVVSNTPLSSAVAYAGGFSLAVDFKRVEITHSAINNVQGSSTTDRELVQLSPDDLTKVAVNPGDIIRFNAVFTDRDSGPVTLAGEFVRPGTYDIKRGERLSQVIARAGGLTEQAYPYGAVFTRVSVKRSEQENLNREAQALQSGLPVALSKSSAATDAQSIILAEQQLLTAVRSTIALGRVVVEADLAVLQVKPQLDTILQPGDFILIPKRPSYVAVAGEVLNPMSLQYQYDQGPIDYINQAGGYAQSADRDGIFIIFPNGKAQPIKDSFWHSSSFQVPPGSTIVVSKDLRPFDLTTFLVSATQIMSQVAISAASLAVINGN